MSRPYTQEDFIKELVGLYHVDKRQDGDVDASQMAEEWDIDARTSRIRLMNLVKQGVLERFKVHDPRFSRPIYVWRKANSSSAISHKPAIISRNHKPKEAKHGLR